MGLSVYLQNIMNETNVEISLEMPVLVKTALLLHYIASGSGNAVYKMIQSSTTPDPEYQWESDKLTVRHQKRETRGQPFPSR